MSAFFQWAAQSDVGRKRSNNEDSFGVFADDGLFFVADGMGGGDDGEVASVATIRAIEKICQKSPQPKQTACSADDVAARIIRSVNGASEWIFRRASAKKLKGCGSTLVGFCLDWTKPERAVALHAGDSRLYRIRGRSIKQITRDHSAAEMIGVSDESKVNPMFRGMILRAVGISPSVDVESTPFDVRAEDRLLVCSDGLSRMVPDKRLLDIVRKAPSPKDAVDSLIAAANEAGGVDNVTAIVVAIGDLPDAVPCVSMPEEADSCGERTPNTASADGKPDTATGDWTSDVAEADTAEQAPDATEGVTSCTCAAVEAQGLSGSCEAVCSSRKAGVFRRYRPDLKKLFRIVAVLAGIALVVAGAAGGWWMWRMHEQKRLQQEKMAREETMRLQEHIRQQELKSAANAQTAAESEKTAAEDRRKAEEVERQQQIDRELAKKKAIREAAERKSEEEARLRRENRLREESERKVRNASGSDLNK